MFSSAETTRAMMSRISTLAVLPACRPSSSARRLRCLARGSSTRYTRWPKPMTRALSARAWRIQRSALAGSLIFSTISMTCSLAPPWSGPLSAPMPETTAEWTSESVAAVTRAAKVEALNSWAAWRMRATSKGFVAGGGGVAGVIRRIRVEGRQRRHTGSENFHRRRLLREKPEHRGELRQEPAVGRRGQRLDVGVELLARRQVAVPQEVGPLLEARSLDQVVHVEAPVDQTALVAVDEADVRGGDDNVFEAGLQRIDSGVAHGSTRLLDTRDDSGCLVPQGLTLGNTTPRDATARILPRMDLPVPPVVDFYSRHPISEGQIVDALRRQGKDLERLQPEDLYDLDQDHYGGLEAVEVLARRARIDAASRVLDVCAGLCGPPRFNSPPRGARRSEERRVGKE